MKQQSLFKAEPLFHGGELALGKRKSRRPFDPKRSLHLTLKAERPVLFARRAEIEKEIRRWAARFHVKLYELAVNFDHLHVLLLARASISAGTARRRRGNGLTRSVKTGTGGTKRRRGKTGSLEHGFRRSSVGLRPQALPPPRGRAFGRPKDLHSFTSGEPRLRKLHFILLAQRAGTPQNPLTPNP